MKHYVVWPRVDRVGAEWGCLLPLKYAEFETNRTNEANIVMLLFYLYICASAI